MKKGIWIIIGLIGIVGTAWFFMNRSETSTNKNKYQLPTVQVQVESVTTSIHAVASVEPMKQSSIAAKVSGNVLAVNVEVGDPVLAQTLLLQVDGEESTTDLAIRQAEEQDILQSYQSQQAYLDEQVLLAERQVAIAVQQLDAAIKQESTTNNYTEESVTLAKEQVTAAKVAREEREQIMHSQLDAAYEQAVSVARRVLAAASGIDSFVASVAEDVERKNNANDEFDDMYEGISFDEKQALLSASISLTRYRTEMEDRFNNEYVGKEVYSDDWDNYLQLLRTLGSETQEALQALFRSIDQVDSGTGNTTLTVITNLRNQTITYSNQIESAIASLNELTSSISTIKSTGSADIAAADQQLYIAQQAVFQAEAAAGQGNTQVLSGRELAEKQVAHAKQQLAAMIAQRSAALRSIELNINKIQGNKKLSQIAVGNRQIGAPYAGVITGKYIEPGQFIAAGQPLFDIADTTMFKIIADVSDKDITALYEGMTAAVSIDGYEEPFIATISNIHPRVDQISRKVPVELLLQSYPENMVIGSFASVSFNKSRDVIRIPYSYVHVNQQGPYITTAEGSTFKVTILQNDQNGYMVSALGLPNVLTLSME